MLSTASEQPMTKQAHEQEEGWSLFSAFLRDYQWIHIGLGLFGNTSFVVGSVFFLWESLKEPAIWLFIAGSAGMLLGSIGSAIVKYEEEKERPDSPYSQKSAVSYRASQRDKADKRHSEAH
jgi:hypothetical protein